MSKNSIYAIEIILKLSLRQDSRFEETMDTIQPIKLSQERKSNLLKEVYPSNSFPSNIKYEYDELLPLYEDSLRNKID